jgi:hypothetical protein
MRNLIRVVNNFVADRPFVVDTPQMSLVASRNHHALEAWERMTTGGVQVVGCNGQQFVRGHAIRLRWTSSLNYTFRASRRAA